MFGPTALKQGGVLMAPLMLLSISVLAAGVDRAMHWYRWRRQADEQVSTLRTRMQGLESEQARRVLNHELRRLDHRFSRWEASMDLAMVLGPLLGLLSTVLGLMNLLQALGPEMLLPRGESLIGDYGRMLIGTALGIVVAVVALLVQRLNRMQRRSVIFSLRDSCLSD